jgi:hypothetical protein
MTGRRETGSLCPCGRERSSDLLRTRVRRVPRPNPTDSETPETLTTGTRHHPDATGGSGVWQRWNRHTDRLIRTASAATADHPSARDTRRRPEGHPEKSRCIRTAAPQPSLSRGHVSRAGRNATVAHRHTGVPDPVRRFAASTEQGLARASLDTARPRAPDNARAGSHRTASALRRTALSRCLHRAARAEE